MSKTIQQRDGFPVEFVEEKRWFALNNARKDAAPKGWNTPANWFELDDIPDEKTVGFSVCGNSSSWAFIDYDHVIDDDGKVFQPAWNLLQSVRKLGRTYTELSQSGHGIHQFVDLADFDFEPESNTDRKIILWMPYDEYARLPQAERDKVPKVELFYGTGGRYVYLTGQHKRYAPNCRIADGELAGSIWVEYLNARNECLRQYGGNAETETESNTRKGTVLYPVSDKEQEDTLDALRYVDALLYGNYITVGQALRNCGFAFEVWDEWCKEADHLKHIPYDDYDRETNLKKWKSFVGNSRWNTGTIFRMAKENGWRPKDAQSLEPEDYTDLGEAETMFHEYGDILRYSRQTDFLVYDGKVWSEDKLRAQALAQKLTDLQLKEAKARIRKERKKVDALTESEADKNDIDEAKARMKRAEKYRDFVIKRRDSSKISAVLKEIAPKVSIAVKQLDSDGYLLNTPSGTVDLRTGEMRPHRAEDYCTKITSVSPDAENAELFEKFVNQITCGDAELARYLQETAGMSCIGFVKAEQLLIATGGGGNGKSTFWNLLSRVLGDYAGSLSSEILVTSCKKNKSPELATLRGKRLILAAELEEGQRLDSGTVKRICSTDAIRAEAKYRDPMEFLPSHHTVLYTNYLPKVGSNDSGTWDRLVVIPFNARFRNQRGEVKDFTTVIYDQCGGAVLSWMIEGARRVIENGFFVEQPLCVKEAITEYRNNNDWVKAFLEARCYIGRELKASAADLYQAYRDHCTMTGDWIRSNSEFAQALEKAGYAGKRTKTGKVYFGLRTKSFSELRKDDILAQKEA